MQPLLFSSPNTHEVRTRRKRQIIGWLSGLAIVVYALLLIPESRFEPPRGAGKQPFFWKQDPFWDELERRFVAARQNDPAILSNALDLLFADARQCVAGLREGSFTAEHTLFSRLETNLFSIAPLVGASPSRIPEFAALVGDIRGATKRQSAAWELGDPTVRDRLYRLLFGARMALESVMVQPPQRAVLWPECQGAFRLCLL